MLGDGSTVHRDEGDIEMATHEAGTELTCGHEGCGCRVRIEVPCHCSGATEPYRCTCGEALVPVQ
ncbi:metallothionein [Mycobacterium paragordonae]|uniref:Metallothionein n=2 Tax=Mycobacterium paragordonae TaxID=1389713 RepID=A0ABQ1CEM8_9MYCO|nr:metallothionein [Mycobacterium paragordonae]